MRGEIKLPHIYIISLVTVLSVFFLNIFFFHMWRNSDPAVVQQESILQTVRQRNLNSVSDERWRESNQIWRRTWPLNVENQFEHTVPSGHCSSVFTPHLLRSDCHICLAVLSPPGTQMDLALFLGRYSEKRGPLTQADEPSFHPNSIGFH